MRKKCFKCNCVKPISDFYKHRMMADGHLNKCIDCAKKDVAERIKIKLTDPVWVANERARCREKQERYRKRGLAVQSRKAKEGWEKRNKHKKFCHQTVSNAIRSGVLVRPKNCQDCGAAGRIQGHHEDYSQPLKVDWLCTKCHGKRHWKDRNFLTKK